MEQKILESENIVIVPHNNIDFDAMASALGISLIAKKLGLTGWVKNTPQGEVEAEIQGEKDKIAFLIKFMKSLKRIKIVKVEEQVMEVIDTEYEFIVIK